MEDEIKHDNKCQMLSTFNAFLQKYVPNYKSMNVNDNPVTKDVDSATFIFSDGKKFDVNLGYEGCEGMFWDLVNGFNRFRKGETV